MKYCTKCGKELLDEAVICTGCGCATTDFPQKTETEADAPNMGFAVLGFFIPLVGLILYLVWKDKTPKKAKSAGKGALIGFCVSVAFWIIYAVILGSLIGSMLGSMMY